MPAAQLVQTVLPAALLYRPRPHFWHAPPVPELKVPAIRQARWNSKRGVLQIAGGGAHANETIQIVDAVTGAADAIVTGLLQHLTEDDSRSRGSS